MSSVARLVSDNPHFDFVAEGVVGGAPECDYVCVEFIVVGAGVAAFDAVERPASVADMVLAMGIASCVEEHDITIEVAADGVGHCYLFPFGQGDPATVVCHDGAGDEGGLRLERFDSLLEGFDPVERGRECIVGGGGSSQCGREGEEMDHGVPVL